MIRFFEYFKWSLIPFTILVVTALGLLTGVKGTLDRLGIFIGLVISYINTLLGYAIILWGYKRSMNKFMASFYGGMIFRFLLIFVVLFVLIVAFEIPIIALIVSLGISYFIFLGLEIYIIHKYSDLK
jgi:F0F1-type ATP synthase assembly protein I